MCDYKCCICNIEDFKDKSSMLQIEDQVNSEKYEHYQKWKKGREEENAINELPFQKGDNAALNPATRTFDSQMFLIGTGSHMCF